MNPVRPTSPVLIAVLIGAGVVVGRLIPPLVVRLDGNVPRLSWIAPLTLLLGAAIVGAFAWSTWQSLHKKHERMTSDHGIKMLSLAKSCSVVGSLLAGLYGGFALAFVGSDSPLGHERLLRGGAAAIASLMLLVAALLLERACRVPGDDDDKDSGGKGSKGRGRPDPTPA